MKIIYTIFGKTRRVKAYPQNMKEDEVPEKVLWIERPEDCYAMMSKEYLGKKVALVYREDWLEAEDI